MLSPGHRARSSPAESCRGWAGRIQWRGAAEHQRGGQHGGQRKPLLQVSRGEAEYVKAAERRDAAAGSQVCSLLECFYLGTYCVNLLREQFDHTAWIRSKIVKWIPRTSPWHFCVFEIHMLHISCLQEILKESRGPGRGFAWTWGGCWPGPGIYCVEKKNHGSSCRETLAKSAGSCCLRPPKESASPTTPRCPEASLELLTPSFPHLVCSHQQYKSVILKHGRQSWWTAWLNQD